MHIGIISDTHGVFDAPLKDFLSSVDEIWHSGDFGGGLETAGEIAAFKPLVGVVGNIDDRALLDEYPTYRFFEREGVKVLMTNIGGYPGRYDSRAYALIDRFKPDIFVCGHSHILKVTNDRERSMLCLNPGAAGQQGFHIVRTALRLSLSNGKIEGLEVWEYPKR